MADLVKALYYPDFMADGRTLAKELLLFDELHFMDRPSITFHKGGNFGTIGAESPVRRFEESFRENGVPLYVHQPYSGPIPAGWYEKVKADLDDPAFMASFVAGLQSSEVFRNLMIAKGNYGEVGDESAVLDAFLSVGQAQLNGGRSATSIFEDDSIKHMDLRSDLGKAKALTASAAICSAKLNFALDTGANEGFSPLADAKPYGDLLGAKYKRAVRNTGSGTHIQITDLSFAVLDELLSKNRIESLSIKEAVEYRKASNDARRAFMEHMSLLQKKQGKIAEDADYSAQVTRIVETEIRPAAHQYRNALAKIDDTLVGHMSKGVLGLGAGSGVVQIFGDLSLPHIIALAGAASAYVTKGLIDGLIAKRATDRECSLSYILSLE